MIWHQICEFFNQQNKQVLMPIIVSKLHFLKIEGEIIRVHPMVFKQSLLRIAPKSFQAVYVNFPSSKTSTMANLQVMIATKNQTVIAFELISIYYASSFDLLDLFFKETLSRDIPSPFQKPKYRVLPYAPLPLFPLLLPPK
jgi:hypothetical protein